MALVALALSLLGGLAAAADWSDPSFGDGGVAEPAPPPRTKGIGVRDLGAARGGRIAAAVGDLEAGPGYFYAARLSARGSLDHSFGSGGYTARLRVHHRQFAGRGVRLHARAVAVQKNGRILLAGFQENEFGGTAPLLARFRPNGALDRGFGQGGKVAPLPASEGSDPGHLKGGGAVRDVAVDRAGRIVAVGGVNESGGGQPAGLVLVYRPDGSLDHGFGSAGRVLLPRPREHFFTGLTSVEPLPDGKLLVAGYLQGRLSLIRLTAEGQMDPAFGGGDGVVAPSAGQPRVCCPSTASLAVARGGRILLGGVAERTREEPVLLFGFRPDGELDRGFGQGGKVVGRPGRPELSAFTALGMASQSNGRILVVGAAERVDRERTVSYRFTAIRYLANGKVDRGFGSGGVHTVEPGQGGVAATALALPDGRAVAGGGLYGLRPGEGPFRPALTAFRPGG